MRKILRYVIAAAVIFFVLMIISLVRNWDTVQAYFSTTVNYILTTVLCIMIVIYSIKLMLKAIVP